MIPSRRPRNRKTSACQRVGGSICDKTEIADFAAATQLRGQKPEKALLWPESIPDPSSTVWQILENRDPLLMRVRTGLGCLEVGNVVQLLR